MKGTPAQLAAYVGKSERTIHRWLANGRLPYTRLAGGLVEVDDRLLFAPDEQEGAILARLTRIEEKLDKLSADVAALAASRPQPVQQPARPAPVVRLHTEQAEYHVRPDIPAGSVQVFAFAKAHNIPSGTAKDQIKSGRLQNEAPDSKSRPGEQEHYFTPEQQQAALQLWRYHPRFQECADCPHG